MTTIQMLDAQMNIKNSLVCVGLDPDFEKLPRVFKRRWRTKERNIFLFLKQIVDLTSRHCCSYKVQKAFFDCLPKGRKLLKKLIYYIHTHHPGIPIFVDCKIGDIDNTMRAYLTSLFDDLDCDGIVVNPYMGDDVFAALSSYKDKAIIVLVQTSNTNASVVQDYHGLWKHILQLTAGRWNENGNLIPVIASTSSEDLRWVRASIPDSMPVLYAGVGAQGGSLSNFSKLLSKAKTGVFVNSSRGILYPYSPCDRLWRSKVVQAVILLKEKLNTERFRI